MKRMGCGVSDLTTSVAKTVYGEFERKTEKGALCPEMMASMKKMAMDTLKNGTIRMTDEKRTVSSTARTAMFQELPENETFDGLLGITSEADIKKLRNLLKNGVLFQDIQFPASNQSLFYSKNRSQGKSEIQWLRPKDLTTEPKIVSDNVTKRDVLQGQLGDCWFLSACAAIAQKPQLLKKVIRKRQVLYGNGYTGMVIFYIWRFGRWVTVCIDDQLPTINGHLIYARCTNNNEFWVPLLEKAYAKLHSSYEALVGGQAKDALVDLTGGLAECYPLKDAKDDFYRRLHRAYIQGAFITCARLGEWDSKNTVDEKGLVSGHAYTVTSVAKIPTKTRKYVNLIRIRNPWGDGAEWNGSWSDSSKRWREINESIKKTLEVADSPDGEFWMSYTDFKKEFRDVTIATLGPESGLSLISNEVQIIRGAWELGKSCGGSRNNVYKFADNPQYLFTISDEETFDEDEVIDLSGRRMVVIALMQEHRHSQNKFSLPLAHIAFVIYKSDESDRKLPPEYFLVNHDLGHSGPHVNFREVTARFHLVPGSYVVIPSTFEDNCARPFLIRVFCDRPFHIKELKGKAIRGWEKIPETTKI